MAAASPGLFASNERSLWQRALACYEEAVKLCAEQKSKSKGTASKTQSLVDLDRWFQKSLPAEVASRDKPHLTHQELAKLMQWKLKRGKFRPRLSQLVKENSPADVERITEEGLARLPGGLTAAVKHLSQLKGVGPATASAILCVAAPETAPFMADEAVHAVRGSGKITYDTKVYVAFARELTEKCQELNTLDVADKQTGSKWTPHKLELALWSYHYVMKHKPDLLERTGDTEQVGQTVNTDQVERTGNTEQVEQTGNTEEVERTGDTEQVERTGDAKDGQDEDGAPPTKKQKLQPSK